MKTATRPPRSKRTTDGDATLPYYGEAGSLYELPPPGYRRALCAISANGEAGLYERLQMMLDNQVPVLARICPTGTIIDCYWFNVPDGVLDTIDDVPARIDIRKYVCPAGYDYDSAGLSL
ncbi:MAG: hypothetical protein R2843_06535 [Thermomicrobiales bacterium]